MRKILRTIFLVVFAALFTVWAITHTVFAFWQETINEKDFIIQIGSWEWEGETSYPIFIPTENYSTGDKFIWDGSIWEVVAGWFEENKFLNPDGSINFKYVKPYGAVQEITDEWRPHNTYRQGDIVVHNGFQWVVRHEGANSQEPGAATNAYNRITNFWYEYNTYEVNDVVEWEGEFYRATSSSWNKQPDLYSWAWIKI